MESKKCISLENFKSDDLVFDYDKEGKIPISVVRRSREQLEEEINELLDSRDPPVTHENLESEMGEIAMGLFPNQEGGFGRIQLFFALEKVLEDRLGNRERVFNVCEKTLRLYSSQWRGMLRAYSFANSSQWRWMLRAYYLVKYVSYGLFAYVVYEMITIW